MAEIELKEVSKIYKGGVKAVDSFSLKIEEGEFIVFVGPSGCGKSTTLRMIAGLEEISSGELYINGEYMNDVEPKDRDLAMVFQNYALYPYLTVKDNISFGLKLRHTPKDVIKQKVAEVAKMLDIEELLDRKPKALSGGQRQRVALGRAVVRDARAYLLDEPLSNLDAKLRASMRVEIIDLHKRLGKTFIYVTHDQIEAMTMGSRIVVMNKGVIQQADTPIEIYDHPANLFVATFIGTPQMNIFEATLEKKAKNAHLVLSDDLSFDVDSSIFDLEGLENGSKVKVGVRAEDITLSDKGMPIVVDLIENLGSELLIHAKFENTNMPIVIKTGERLSLNSGDKAFVTFKKGKTHLFNIDTEVSLRRKE